MRIDYIAVFAALGLAGCAPVVLPPAQGEGTRALTSFGFVSPPVQATITEETRTISLKVPARTDCASLVAVFVISGPRVTVAGVEQVSGRTVNDFQRPVEYVVERADGSTVTYVVRVSVEPPLGEAKAISLFSFLEPQVSGSIDESRHTISVVVPWGTDISSLVAVFTTSGVRVAVDDTEQQSGVTINDFTEPITYTVTAQDDSTASYLVGVEGAPSQEKQLTSFSFQCPGSAAVIDEAQHIVRSRVPAGTDLTALIAVFATTGIPSAWQARCRKAGLPGTISPCPLSTRWLRRMDPAPSTACGWWITLAC